MAPRFGTDGVRGAANADLTPEVALALGKAVVRVLGNGRPFVVARDTRRSGPMLEAALAAGVAAEGADVVSAGVLPTPGAAYLAGIRQCPAAVISASHNPWPDNGIKFFAAGGRKLTNDQERAVEAAFDDLRAVGPGGPGTGTSEVGGLESFPGGSDAYADHLVACLEGRRLCGVRVVIDCGHGAASAVAPAVFERAGAKVEVRNASPDGMNINAGSGATAPEAVAAEVVALGAAAGLAFDGDADRCIAVDESGGIVDGDHLLAVAALDLRRRGVLHHEAVATTVMANLGFRRAMEAEGVRVVETAVGDRAVLEAMEAGGLALGGEQSGHLIYADLATTGDGILSGLMLLDVMARSRRPLSQLASVVVKLPQVLRNVRVADRADLPGATGFWDEVAAAEAELGDGGRVLVRPSGTEPLVRVMVEASTEAAAERHVTRLVAALTAVLGPG
ncbi:MAG: phosphoglucosamine mutase [Acidimicrobiia bacterium]